MEFLPIGDCQVSLTTTLTQYHFQLAPFSALLTTLFSLCQKGLFFWVFLLFRAKNWMASTLTWLWSIATFVLLSKFFDYVCNSFYALVPCVNRCFLDIKEHWQCLVVPYSEISLWFWYYSYLRWHPHNYVPNINIIYLLFVRYVSFSLP